MTRSVVRRDAKHNVRSHLRHQVGVTLELLSALAHQSIFQQGGTDRLILSLLRHHHEVGFGLQNLHHRSTVLAIHGNAEIIVGQLNNLTHTTNHAHPMQLVRFGIILGHIFL